MKNHATLYRFDYAQLENLANRKTMSKKYIKTVTPYGRSAIQLSKVFSEHLASFLRIQTLCSEIRICNQRVWTC